MEEDKIAALKEAVKVLIGEIEEDHLTDWDVPDTINTVIYTDTVEAVKELLED